MSNLKFFLCTALVLALFSCKDQKEPAVKDTSENLIEKALEEAFDPTDYPLIFRRTTLIVRDLEKSMALYRDAMGMEVIYDNIIRRPHKTEEGEEEIRLVFLKANDSYYGVLGLLEYEYNKKDKVAPPVRREGFAVQNSVLLFNTTDLDSRFDKIKRTPGVEIFREPSLREYPSYDGEGTIQVKVSIFYDPDGFLVEFNQPLTTISLDQ